MGSKREEERNEKIIRGLMKLPPNRRCINCNSLGPQYVCTTFWTFVCMACSGIHREFTHRVKSVSMSKFTSQEVEVLQTGGNQRAREIYLRHWDHQRQRFPDSSNADKVREFIKNVYVQKKYAGSNATDKPLKDCQNHGSSEDVTRRADSYHSYSQSPPYDYQYEERRYGKIPLGFSNKSASTRGLHAKASSFVYSPGRFSDHMFEDQFANEGSAPRASDFSASSGGDPFRSQTQSPNFQHEVGFRSPQIQHSKTPSNENIFPGRQHQRTTSFGSVRSVDSNFIPIKSHASSVVGEAISEHCQNTGNQQDKTSTPVDSVADLTKAPLDLFQLPGAPAAQYVNTFQPSTGTRPEAVDFCQPPQTYPSNQADLFAEVVSQQATARPPHMPVPKSEGWASFDNPVPAPIATNAITTAEPVNLHPPPQTYPSSQEDLFAGIVSQQPTAIPPQMYVPRSEAWASFENPMPAAIAINDIISSGVAKLEVKSEGISQPSTSMNWPPNQPIVDQHALSIPTPWQDDLSGVPNNVAGNPPWNAFADSIKTNPLENANQTHQLIDGASTSSSNVDQQRLEPQVVEELSNDCPETVRFPDSSSGFDFPGSIGIAPAYSPLMEEPWQHLNRQKSANPFDLPYDSEFDSNDMFVDMSSLQGELPDFHTEPAFLNGVSQPWLATDSVAPYLPASAGTQGGIACMASGQTSKSQLENAAAQGPVASTGGNPFA